NGVPGRVGGTRRDHASSAYEPRRAMARPLARSLDDGKRQGLQSADRETRLVPQRLFSDGELDARRTRDERLERDARLHPGQRGSETEVLAQTEAQVRLDVRAIEDEAF